MLTTTIDGLWVLQVLSGIETLAPELGLRPILPSVESRQAALAHPITAELRSAGVIDDAGVPDRTVVDWLTVLSRRDVALVMHFHRLGDGPPARVVIARFASWWVVMERSAELVRLSGAGVAGTEDTAGVVLAGQIERLCGVLPPARLRPVTLDAKAFRTAVADRDGLRRFLRDQRLDAEQRQLILLAADPSRCARASIAAVQAGVATGRPSRSHVGAAVVSVLDTAEGRLLAERVNSAGRTWLIVAPASAGDLAAAVDRLLRALPADRQWHSYRKAV